MINPFILNPVERIKIWRDLRDELKEKSFEKQLESVSNFWWQAPMQTFCLDYDRPEEWPSPWEIVYFNGYDSVARAVMMAETLILTFEELYYNCMELLYIRDLDRSDELMILIINDYVLNYELNTVLPFDKLSKNYTIYNRYVRDDKNWKIVYA